MNKIRDRYRSCALTNFFCKGDMGVFRNQDEARYHISRSLQPISSIQHKIEYTLEPIIVILVNQITKTVNRKSVLRSLQAP